MLPFIHKINDYTTQLNQHLGYPFSNQDNNGSVSQVLLNARSSSTVGYTSAMVVEATLTCGRAGVILASLYVVARQLVRAACMVGTLDVTAGGCLGGAGETVSLLDVAREGRAVASLDVAGGGRVGEAVIPV